jgi:hypothetical protein
MYPIYLGGSDAKDLRLLQGRTGALPGNFSNFHNSLGNLIRSSARAWET